MVDILRKPVEILKGRQTLTPEEYGEWVAAVHNLPSDEVEYDPDTDLVWYKAKVDEDNPGPEFPELMLICDPPWKPKSKRIRTIGHPLRNFADLGVLTRAWRKPTYKNLRYLYIKDGVIVEYEGVKRRGGSATFLDGSPLKTIMHIKERIVALGADSLFVVHNHPSKFTPLERFEMTIKDFTSGRVRKRATENPTPSKLDRTLAILLAKVPELKGHIVVHPVWFGLITLEGLAILRKLPDLH